jgi:hypothetical protein
MLEQVIWLLVLALPVACISRTVTQEELFREAREGWVRRSEQSRSWLVRKFYYALTCDYCFSHYVAAGFIALTGFQILLSDWRGYLLAWFALVAVANVYSSAYARLRVDIHKTRAEAKQTEANSRQNQKDRKAPAAPTT